MEFPFSDSGTKRLNIVIPFLGTHVFRPEGPGSALGRAGFINRTFFSRKINAIGTPVFNQVIATVGSNAVLLRELTSGHLEKLSQVFSIFAREIDVAVFATRGTAIARLLTLKADSLVPPRGLLFLTHFLQFTRGGRDQSQSIQASCEGSSEDCAMVGCNSSLFLSWIMANRKINSSRAG